MVFMDLENANLWQETTNSY